MVTPVVENVPSRVAGAGRDRTDLAMDVLQYGAAILAIIVVALLTVVR